MTKIVVACEKIMGKHIHWSQASYIGTTCKMPFITDDRNCRGWDNEYITQTDVQLQETNAKLYISFAT